MAAVQKYSALHMMPFVLATTQLRVHFCQTVTFNCTLSGMLAHYSSTTPVVLHVSSTLVVGSPASSVDLL